MKLKRSCPLCNENEGRKLFTISTNINGISEFPDEYNIVVCEKCGMIYADSSLKKEVLDKYYQEQNIYENISTVKKEIYDESHSVYYRSICQFCSQNEDILDVGCGRGNVISYLRTKGYKNLSGLDPSENSIRHLKEEGFAAFCGSIYNFGEKGAGKRFDAILCVGVLEHFLDLQTALKNVAELLKENGKLYVAVPAAEEFGKYIRELPNYFNVEHINYFTLKTLDSLLRQHGFARMTREDESFATVNLSAPEVIISAIYKKEKLCIPSEIAYDNTGINSVKKWMKERKVAEKHVNKILEEIQKSDKKYVIWGTGNFSAYLLQRFPELLDNITCFVDNNEEKWGKKFFDKKICMPEELVLEKEIHILICSMMSAESIAQQIMGMRLDYTIIRYEIGEEDSRR